MDSDHEAHDFVGRVHHAQAIGGLGVIDLVEVLVNDLQEGLLFVVARDLAGGAADRGVVGLERLQGLVLGVAGEEGMLQLVQLARDVVVLVVIGAGEHQCEDFLGEDVLDQDLAHVGFAERRVDRFLRLLQELVGGGPEARVVRIGLLDHAAQRIAHRRQVDLELFDRLAEFRDLRALVAEEQLQQALQLVDVVHRATDHFPAVLDQHRLARIFEDDVVLRIAALELQLDLGVEVVALVLGFPVAEWQAQAVQQRAVHVAAFPGGRFDFVFGNEGEVVRAAPVLQQILECLAYHALAVRATDLAQPREFGEVVLDQHAGHAVPPCAAQAITWCSRRR